MFNITPIVLNLIIINTLVYFSSRVLGQGANEFLSLHFVENSAFNPIQFFTYMFAHASGSHIFFNMLGLFFFGPILEKYWGSKKFLIYYTICGIGAGILYSGYVYLEMNNLKNEVNSYIQTPTPEKFANFLEKNLNEYYKQSQQDIVAFKEDPSNNSKVEGSIEIVKQVYFLKSKTKMLGASGALYAVLLGVGLIFPFMEVFLLFPPIPLKMMYVVIFYGLTAVYGMVQQQTGDNVAHFAHLSGMIVGFILLKLIWKERRADYY